MKNKSTLKIKLWAIFGLLAVLLCTAIAGFTGFFGLSKKSAAADLVVSGQSGLILTGDVTAEDMKQLNSLAAQYPNVTFKNITSLASDLTIPANMAAYIDGDINTGGKKIIFTTHTEVNVVNPGTLTGNIHNASVNASSISDYYVINGTMSSASTLSLDNIKVQGASNSVTASGHVSLKNCSIDGLVRGSDATTLSGTVNIGHAEGTYGFFNWTGGEIKFNKPSDLSKPIYVGSANANKWEEQKDRLSVLDGGGDKGYIIFTYGSFFISKHKDVIETPDFGGDGGGGIDGGTVDTDGRFNMYYRNADITTSSIIKINTNVAYFDNSAGFTNTLRNVNRTSFGTDDLGTFSKFRVKAKDDLQFIQQLPGGGYEFTDHLDYEWRIVPIDPNIDFNYKNSNNTLELPQGAAGVLPNKFKADNSKLDTWSELNNYNNMANDRYSWSVTGKPATIDSKSGLLKYSEKGERVVKFTFLGSANYFPKTIEHNVEVLGVQLQLPKFNDNTFEYTYDGNNDGVADTYDRTNAIYVGGVEYKTITNGGQRVINDATGTLSAQNAGTYKITLTIKDGSYDWANDSNPPSYVNRKNSTTVELTWKINKRVLAIPALKKTSFNHNGTRIVYNILSGGVHATPQTYQNISNYNEATFTKFFDVSGTTYASETNGVGESYSFNVTIKSGYTSNYTFRLSDDLQTATINWKIVVPTPDYKLIYEGVLTVGGSAITPQTFGKVDGATEHWSISGNNNNIVTFDSSTGKVTPLHAGTVTVTWTVDTYEIYAGGRATATLTVEPRKFNYPTLTQTSFVFNNSNQDASAKLSGMNSTYMQVSGHIQKNVGNYELSISFKTDANNRAGDNVWLTTGKNEAYKIKWSITGATLTISIGYNDDINDIYVGTNSSAFFVQYPSGVSGGTATWKVNSTGGTATIAQNGVLSPISAGTVVIEVTLTGVANYGSATATRTITIKALNNVTIPTVKTNPTYNGSSRSPEWNNYNTSLMTIGGQTSGINVGEYTATFTLKDKKRYQWSVGTKADQNVKWVIIPQQITLSFHYPNSNTVVFGSTTTPIVDGNVLPSCGAGARYSWTVSSGGGTASIDNGNGVLTPTRVGDVVVTLDVVNHSANVTIIPVSVRVNIQVLKITIPTKTTNGSSLNSPDFRYNNGIECELQFNNLNTKYVIVTGNTASVAGQHVAHLELKDNVNTAWTDNSVGVRDVYWYIGKGTMTENDITITYGTIIYGTDSGTPQVDGDISGGARSWRITSNTSPCGATIKANGNITPQSSGNLTIELTIAATDNYNAVTKRVTVRVYRKTVSVPKLVGQYIWDGNPQTVEIQGFDSSYMQATGRTQTNANASQNDHYQVVVSFSNPANLHYETKYRWDDNADENNSGSRTLLWRIERAKIAVPSLTPESLPYSSRAQTTVLSSNQYITNISVPSGWSRNGTTITIPGGTQVKANTDTTNYYPITLSPDSNHRWDKTEYDVSTMTLKFTITRANITLDFSYASAIKFGSDSCQPTPTGNSGGGRVTWSIADGTGTGTINSANGVITPTKAGSVLVSMTVEATRNYKGGTQSHMIDIGKATFDPSILDRVSWKNDQGGSYVYNGNNYSVSINPSSLPAGIQNIVYENNVQKDAGTYTAKVKSFDCDPNYEVPTIKSYIWKINKANINGASLSITADANSIVYDGDYQRPTYSIVLYDLASIDYTVSWSNNVNAGTATLTITAKPDSKNFTGAKSVNFTIRKADYVTTGMTWNYTDPFVYTGSAHTVTVINLPRRIDGQEIGVTYSNNSKTDVNTYTATATFVADPNYNTPAAISCTWKIVKATYDLSNVRWDYTKPFVFDNTVKTVQIIASTLPAGILIDYKGTNSKTNAGTYTAKATVMGYNHNYYEPVLPDCVWTINKATFNTTGLAWNYTGKFTYNGSAQSVEVNLGNLASELTAHYSGTTSATNAGTYTANVVFTCDSNHIAPTLQACVWTIDKASYNMSGVVWDYKTPFVYSTGVDHTVSLSSLPRGVIAADDLAASDVHYVNNTKNLAGSYTASVTFDYDKVNYVQPSVSNIVWEISKQSLSKPYVVGSLIYNGNVQNVNLAGFTAITDKVSVSGTDSATNAGAYKVSIDLVNTDNYMWADGTTETLVLNWFIGKATYDMSGVMWDTTVKFTYDGTEKGIAIDETTLPKKNPNSTDNISVRLYSGNRATNAGKYYANVKSFDYDDVNYFTPQLTNPCEWEIEKADIKDAVLTITTAPSSIMYTGSEIRPDYRIVFLTLSRSDYDVIWSNNINAGTATLMISARKDTVDEKGNTIPGSMNFTGNIHVDFTILKATFDLSNVYWFANSDLVYDGTSKTVELGGLPDGISVKKYFNNSKIDAGTYSATVELDYNASNYNLVTLAPYNWTITRAMVNKPAAVGEYVYNGNLQTVNLEGFDSKTMTVTGNTGTDAGVYNAVISLKNIVNYEWSDTHSVDDYTIRWAIDKATVDVSNAVWNYASIITYDGREHTIIITGLPSFISATYVGNIATDAGQYHASATLNYNTNNYNEISVPECDWEIGKADIANAKVTILTSPDEIIYKGEEWRPAFSATYLTLGANDYVVTYAGNVNANEHATITITAKIDSTNFKGSKTVEFTIRKATFDLSGVSWKYSVPFIYNGLERVVELQNLPEGLTAVYTGNSATDAGDYTASVTLINDDTVNYVTPVFTDVCDWKILKADYDMSNVVWDYKPVYVYDGSAKSVSIIAGLPEGVTVKEYAGNFGTNAGTYYASVKSFNYDTVNYNEPKLPYADGQYTWIIEKAEYNMSNAAWDYASAPFVYDNTAKTVSVIGLPTGVTVSEYLGNTATDAGDYTAYVISLNYDSTNYNEPQFTKPCNWQIAKADISHANLSIKTPANTIIYKGEEWQPEFVINYLTLGAEDYDVIWGGQGSDNVNASTNKVSAKLTVTAKPDSTNFTGTVSVNFKILKATFDISGVTWDYEAPFQYTGLDHEVLLKDLPEGLTAQYAGNVEKEVDSYTASVLGFDYDTANYNEPVFTKVCVWEITKADLTASDILWFEHDGVDTFDRTYYFDGVTDYKFIAKVKLDGVDELYDLPVLLTKNGVETLNAICAGNYEAVAVSNKYFNLTEYAIKEFTVRKMRINAGEILWQTADGAEFEKDGKIEFNGSSHMPKAFKQLDNGTMYELPVAFTRNGSSTTSVIYAGEYTAAALSNENFEVFELGTVYFEITKAVISANDVIWNMTNNEEFVFDGNNHMPVAQVEFNGKTYTLTVDLVKDGARVLSAVEAGNYAANVIESDNFTIDGFAGVSFKIKRALINAGDIVWSISNNSKFTFNGTDNFAPKATCEYNGKTYNLNVELALTSKEGEAASKAINAGSYIATAITGGNFEIEGSSTVAFIVEKFQLTSDKVEWSFGEDAQFIIGEKPNASAVVRIGGKEYVLDVTFEKIGGDTEGWTVGSYIATVNLGDVSDNIELVGTITRNFRISNEVSNNNAGAVVGNDNGNDIWWMILLGFDAIVLVIDVIALLIAIRKFRKSKALDKKAAKPVTEPVADIDGF